MRERKPQPAAASGRLRRASRSRARRSASRRRARKTFLSAMTLGLGAAIGAHRHHPAARLRRPAALQEGRGLRRRRRRPRAARHLRRGRVADHEVQHAAGARRRGRAHGVRPLQRPAGGRAELHDPLQPLRPPRLPRAGERPDDAGEAAHVPRRPAEGDATRRAPGRLRLSVPRRPVRHRGQPHGGAARPRARPLGLQGRGRPAAARRRLQRQRGRGHGRGRDHRQVPARAARASTSTASSRSSTPSSRRADAQVRRS